MVQRRVVVRVPAWELLVGLAAGPVAGLAGLPEPKIRGVISELIVPFSCGPTLCCRQPDEAHTLGVVATRREGFV